LPKMPVIAIVDDDESFRRATTSFVRSLGYGTASFDSAEAFLKSEKISDADCLITDVQMPGMSGFKMVESIRALQPKIPVLFISGTVDELPKWADMTCSVLRKPFAAENVKAAVEKCLSGRP